MPLDLETRDQLLETVRRFVRETCVPIEAKVAEDDRVPDSVIAEMRALGSLGLSIPEEYGGLGLAMEEEVLVAMELGHTSPAFRSVIGTNVGIGSQGVVMFGSDAQKREWPAEARERRGGGELLPYRAGRGLRRRVAADHRDPRRRRLCRQRHQTLHHQRQPRRHVHADGAQRSLGARAPRVSRPSSFGRHQGYSCRSAGKEDGPAGRAYLRRRVRERARAGAAAPGRGRRGLPGGDAGARPWPAAHLRRLRRRGRSG